MIGADLAKRLFRACVPAPGSAYSKKSYSQFGEDILVASVLGWRGIARPSYLDIGANHPYYLSNTALFYEKGRRGINVEPNPQLIPAFHKYRPKDITLNVGVGSQRGELEFFVMEDNTLSTFSKDERDRLLQWGHRQSAVGRVTIASVSSILDDHFGGEFPDFLSLDAEGMDIDILRSVDFDRHHPKVICVEAKEYSTTGTGARRLDLIEFLISKGYFEYASTGLNSIMVKEEFWDIPAPNMATQL